MNNYIFSNKITKHHKQLIKQSIKLLLDLNVPISNKCFFDVSHAQTMLGWCKKHEKYGHKIALNPSIVKDHDYMDVTIHELIHTIPNKGYTSHKGNWEYWSNYVRNSSEYEIKICSKVDVDLYDLAKYKKKGLVKKVICPLCNKEVETIIKSDDNETNLLCPKCIKPFFLKLPGSPIKDLSIAERDETINKLIKENKITLNNFQIYLPYTSRESTRAIVREILYKNAITIELKHAIYHYIYSDKPFLKELADLYCHGRFDKLISDFKTAVEFEGIFALTKYWKDVADYSNMRFKVGAYDLH